jgi:5-methylcytosine-specific restriction endonuclease McrA
MKRIPWNKGKKGVYSKETLEIMSLKKKGIKNPEHSKRMRGRKMTPENKAIAIKNLTHRFKKGDTAPMFGKKRPDIAGEKNKWWKGGVSPMYAKLRAQRLKENGGSHTLGEWENLKAQYGYTCPMCERKELEIKLTKDHIIPVSKGGSDFIENIQPLCISCNSRKNDKLIIEVQITNKNKK